MASQLTTRPEASMVSVKVKSPWQEDGMQREQVVNDKRQMKTATPLPTLTVCTMENVNTHTREHRKPRHKLLYTEREARGITTACACQTTQERATPDEVVRCRDLHTEQQRTHRRTHDGRSTRGHSCVIMAHTSARCVWITGHDRSTHLQR